jgi:aromatic ring-opening dioxygenase catalytic subunit (LigB family)
MVFGSRLSAVSTRDNKTDGVTRREAIGAAVAGVAIAALPDCKPDVARTHTQDRPMRTNESRMPVVYLPHGGGPWPFVDLGFGDRAELDQLATYLRSLHALPPRPPRAVLAISAHWEEPVPTVMTAERPPLFYDYYGFPPEAYTITWPAPGHPELAARVQQLLGAAGFDTAVSRDRGFDHGTFVPLKLTYPAADMPTIQLSLQRGLDPERHIAIGRALAPLRDEGVFIVGSGMSYHNMRGFGGVGRAASAAFDAWLNETIVLDESARTQRLTQWSTAPSAREAHPREEHLLPLMVVSGAAGGDRGRTAYNGSLMGVQISAHHFG